MILCDITRVAAGNVAGNNQASILLQANLASTDIATTLLAQISLWYFLVKNAHKPITKLICIANLVYLVQFTSYDFAYLLAFEAFFMKHVFNFVL